MTEIPVEKKSAIPLWVWLLAALIIIALIWWIVDESDDRDEVAAIAPPAEQVLPADTNATGADITDQVVIIALPDRRPLIGRNVRLTNVKVLDVVGDQAFWIGSGPDQRVLVAMQEVPPPGGPGQLTDADINIDPGQTINLTGQVRALPALTGTDRSAADTLFGPAFADAAKNEQIYIFARGADIVAQP